MEVTTIGLSLVAGFVVGRWWSALLALPVALVAQSAFSFEGFSDAEVGVLFGIASAIGLIVGTGARKLLGARGRSWRDGSG